MSAARFTPGPWSIRLHRLFSGEDVVGGIFDAKGEKISVTGVTLSSGPECEANARLIAASPRLFDALETLVDALTTGAGRDFIEAFVRDASAALEEAQPGWNKVDEPTATQMRALGRTRAAAPQLQDALAHLIRWHDQLTPADVARAKAVLATATGEAQ